MRYTYRYTHVDPIETSINVFAHAESYLRKQHADVFYPRSARLCAAKLKNLAKTLFEDAGAVDVRFYLSEIGTITFECNDENDAERYLEDKGIGIVAVITLTHPVLRRKIAAIEWRNYDFMGKAYRLADENDDDEVELEDGEPIDESDDVITAEIVDATPDRDEDDEGDWEWDDNDMIEKDGYQIILS